MKAIKDLTIFDLKPYFTKQELCIFEIVNNNNLIVNRDTCYSLAKIPNMILSYRCIGFDRFELLGFRISGMFSDRKQNNFTQPLP